MKLREMALVYRANNALLGLRLRELRKAARETRDREERLRLRRRMAALAPLYREGRATAALLERYYTGKGVRHEEP